VRPQPHKKFRGCPLSVGIRKEVAEYAERTKGGTLGIGRIDSLTGLWRTSFPTRDRYG
jgi:hypothetical protein